MERSRARSLTFWSIIAGVVAADVVTKALAVAMLVPQHVPREVIGDWVRLTLVYNRGAAFGLHLGPWSRAIFLVLTLVALIILGRLYRATRPGDTLRIVSLALVCGGAIGNLIDRVRSGLGVVDFLDVGVHEWRWPTFNIADMAVSIGAFLLAWVLWWEDRAAHAAAEPMSERLPAPKPSQGA
ncbi:MAG TPA: signal peptidase II [Gemmatimonadaceae bacterium]|nr:signal peptidase II [Gemmatimonadaceae bacterium]